MGYFGRSPKILKIANFQDIPKNHYFGKNGNFGFFGKMGYFSHFAEIGEKWKNGYFCVFWKNGGSVENDILTDIGKTVKNGVFLTFCHSVENGGIRRSGEVSTGVKRSRFAILGSF
jgi:hypothetical protein